MAGPASGSEHIEAARKLLKTARTAGELRLAQAVLLPLEQGLHHAHAFLQGDELREKYFHNQAFDSLDALEDRLVLGLQRLERQPAMVKSIAGRDWIINSVSNANYN